MNQFSVKCQKNRGLYLMLLEFRKRFYIVINFFLQFRLLLLLVAQKVHKCN
jgi:hypothetical protein